MFAAPPEQTLEWNDAGVEGAHRFLRRLWNFGAQARRGASRRSDAAPARGRQRQGAAPRGAHGAAARSSYDYERMQYNTVVSGAMKLLNALEDFKAGGERRRRRGAARRLRHPAARAVPGLPAHHARAVAASSATPPTLGDLLDAPWPEVDEAALVQDEIELVLQVNGKLRGAIRVPAGADKAAIEAAALASPRLRQVRRGRARRRR